MSLSDLFELTGCPTATWPWLTLGWVQTHPCCDVPVVLSGWSIYWAYGSSNSLWLSGSTPIWRAPNDAEGCEASRPASGKGLVKPQQFCILYAESYNSRRLVKKCDRHTAACCCSRHLLTRRPSYQLTASFCAVLEAIKQAFLTIYYHIWLICVMFIALQWMRKKDYIAKLVTYVCIVPRLN